METKFIYKLNYIKFFDTILLYFKNKIEGTMFNKTIDGSTLHRELSNNQSFPLTGCQRLSRFLLAAFATITIFPLIFKYKAIKQLWREALNLESTKTHEIALRVLAPPKPEKATFDEISKENLLKLQNKIQATSPIRPPLNLDSLSDVERPKYEMTINQTTYYCSEPFIFENRPMAIILVEIGDKIYPRLAYLSNSQGSWRVMPAATKDYGALLRRFGKGLGETDTQLPITLNLALLLLPRLQKLEYDWKRPLSDLVTTAYDATESYMQKVKKTEMLAALEPDAKDYFCNGGMFVRRPPKPGTIQMLNDPKKHPDFKKLERSEKLTLPMYGEITAEVYASKDKTLQYLFYKTRDNRVFLSAIDAVDKVITSYGVREKFIDLKGLDAPLLEYRKQIPQEFVPEAELKEQIYECGPEFQAQGYTSNWNYVRELAIIKMYYNDQGLEIPNRV